MDTSENLFHMEGEYWTVAYDGHVVRLRDRRGLHFLAHLLAHPRVLIPARDLLVAGGGRSPVADPDARERARVTVTKGIKSAIQAIRDLHAPLGEHLDATIRCGYRCSYLPDPRVPIAWQGQRHT